MIWQWHSLFYLSNLHRWPVFSRVQQLLSELLAVHKNATENVKSGKQSEWAGSGHPGVISRKMIAHDGYVD